MNILVIGAHPDDGEGYCGGTAVKLTAAGHAVKFLSLANGDAGHHVLSGPELAATRAGEVAEARRRLGIAESVVLDNHDGELMPTLELRHEVVRQIRSWNADVVITHSPGDYHPDHRYTSISVQDAAYLVVVPAVCRDVPPLRRNPMFLYMEQEFSGPLKHAPDIAIAIDDVWDRKVSALDAHTSQFYEWLPWVDGELDKVPLEHEDRLRWLGEKWSWPVSDCMRTALANRYGDARGQAIRHAEAFTICGYGRPVSAADLSALFPL